MTTTTDGRSSYVDHHSTQPSPDGSQPPEAGAHVGALDSRAARSSRPEAAQAATTDEPPVTSASSTTSFHLHIHHSVDRSRKKEQQPDPRVLQTKPLQESSRILDFDYTVSLGEQLSGNENIASKTVEYHNLLSVADGQYQPTECTHFATQSVTDEKECFILDELMIDYPPGFEVPQSVAVEKECSSIKDTIADYPPGFEINTVQDATNEPGQPNTIASNLTEVEQLENSSGLEQNTLGQSDAGLAHD